MKACAEEIQNECKTERSTSWTMEKVTHCKEKHKKQRGSRREQKGAERSRKEQKGAERSRREQKKAIIIKIIIIRI